MKADATIEIDLSSLTVARGGTSARLTKVECELFAALAKANGRALSFDFLHQVIEYATGRDSGLMSLTVHVTNIRRKLKEFGLKIENVKAVGYRMQRGSFAFLAPIQWDDDPGFASVDRRLFKQKEAAE